MDSDRVAVMSAGQLVEFDSPSKLLENPVSHFSQLVNGWNFRPLFHITYESIYSEIIKIIVNILGIFFFRIFFRIHQRFSLHFFYRANHELLQQAISKIRCNRKLVFRMDVEVFSIDRSHSILSLCWWINHVTRIVRVLTFPTIVYSIQSIFMILQFF